MKLHGANIFLVENLRSANTSVLQYPSVFIAYLEKTMKMPSSIGLEDFAYLLEVNISTGLLLQNICSLNAQHTLG